MSFLVSLCLRSPSLVSIHLYLLLFLDRVPPAANWIIFTSLVAWSRWRNSIITKMFGCGCVICWLTLWCQPSTWFVVLGPAVLNALFSWNSACRPDACTFRHMHCVKWKKQLFTSDCGNTILTAFLEATSKSIITWSGTSWQFISVATLRRFSCCCLAPLSIKNYFFAACGNGGLIFNRFLYRPDVDILNNIEYCMSSN